MPDHRHPRRNSGFPTYSLHSPSGHARVKIEGREIWLGRYDSPESRARYDQLIAEWLAAGRRLPASWRRDGDPPVTVTDLIHAYKRHAESYYVKHGRPTQTLANIKRVMRTVRTLYGSVPVDEFGPTALKAVRQTFIDDGLRCRTVNYYTGWIKACFKWGVGEEMVAPATLQGLQAVAGLKAGRCGAPASEPVRPVSDEVVEATLPHLPPIVADMVRLQRLIGCRPGEICQMTTGSLDTSGTVWEYRPPTHKTEHHGKSKVYPVGPKAQMILRGHLRPELDRPLFSPAESEAQRRTEAAAARTTRPTASQRRRDTTRAKRAASRRRPAKAQYTTDSYRRAIVRAAQAAGVPQWHPHQLRHTRATEVRREYGLDAAAALIGNTIQAAEIYAERDLEVARRIAMRTG